MNDLLELRGNFIQCGNESGGSPANIPRGKALYVEHIEKIRNDLLNIIDEWSSNKLLDNVLVSVHYIKVVSKTNRIKNLLKPKGLDINSTIRGSKFEGDIKHVFTHYVSLETIHESIELLETCIDCIKKEYGDSISYEQIDKINKNTYKFKDKNISMTKFRQLLSDCYYVSYINIEKEAKEVTGAQIVTLFDVSVDVKSLLKKLDIEINFGNILEDNTVLLSKDQYYLLKTKAPYLIAMQVDNFAQTPTIEDDYFDDIGVDYPMPNNEPVVGVIDTHFDEKISFHNWVKYVNKMDDPNIVITPEDRNHGTAVTSIIVDGPSFNKEYDDGCGKFRVRHFGVALHNGFEWFSLYSTIEEIVRENRDIKVWNLSLGAKTEIDRNFISPIAYLLDKLQNELDIIFVVAGTNKNKDYPNANRIGAPADSLNSIVVNSVNKNSEPASYTREGPVLSFFNKPDVSYYGGDKNEYITVATTRGMDFNCGTSFAAPWITRKVAYLIHVIGLSKEAAKALIIDSAVGWNTDLSNKNKIGYGVVPIKISDILSCRDDEIRFIINETAENYKIYTHDLPLPIRNDKYNYFAKATLCYFPKCDRNQGVDYTTGEMNLTFGRMKIENNKPCIKSINKNNQDNSDGEGTLEKDAREVYRKWDNVKHICTGISSKQKPKDTFGLNKWGISITTKDRIETGQNRGTNFCLVVTFREMEGNNYIREFIDLCKLNNWNVNIINIKNRIDIHNLIEEDIEFSE